MSRAVLRLDVRSDLGELAQASERADAFLTEHGRDETARYAVRLVLEELLSNVIRHGYGPGARSAIAVSLEVTPEEVTLEIVDDARAFDPLSAPPLDVDAPLEERGTGGMGIHLVRSMAREVRYRREGGRNHVRVRI